jgi:hypothetical protein
LSSFSSSSFWSCSTRHTGQGTKFYVKKTAFQILYSSVSQEHEEKAQTEHMKISHRWAPIRVHRNARKLGFFSAFLARSRVSPCYQMIFHSTQNNCPENEH